MNDRGIKSADGKTDTIVRVFRIKKKQTNSTSASEDRNVRLATLRVSMADLTGWKLFYNDPEDKFAAHRFGWILPILASGVTKENIKGMGCLIQDWIRHNPYEYGADGWDTYSVSERIINWIYYQLFETSYCNSQYDKNIITSLLQQVDIVYNHLEFRSNGTNNHLLNNGRALYIAGRFLGVKNITEAGQEIIRQTSRVMFSQAGFLREGSSHYQILMARTFLEIIMTAENSKDDQFLREIEPTAKKIVEAAAFFLMDRPFPVFGDTSPDFSTGFHSGLLHVANCFLCEFYNQHSSREAGWHSLFLIENRGGESSDYQENEMVAKKREPQTIEYPESGYFRIKMGDMVFYLYANPLGYVPEWSHGHADIGGFVLYQKGIPIIVDNGRFDFRPMPMGEYGKSIRSHNGISIDGYEPCVTHSHNGFAQLMVKAYLEHPPHVSIDKTDRAVSIRIDINSFKRIASDLKVTRKFTITSSSLEIEDIIRGRGCRLAETFFHFSPGLTLASQSGNSLFLYTKDQQEIRFQCRSGFSNFTTSRKKSDDRIAGWHFPEYGSKQGSLTVVNSQSHMLPIINKYSIKGSL